MASGGAASRLRVGLDVDRSADPVTWAMTDLTADTQTGGTIAVRRGRSGGAQESQPGQCTVPLNVRDGALTPLYPASPYYPDLDLGVPVEISVTAGDPSLLTFDDSGGASTPDTAVLDIVGDIAVAVEVESPLRFGGYGPTHPVLDLLKKFRVTSDQRSWLLTVGITGGLNLIWTTGGTLATQVQVSTTLRLPRYDSGPAVYGAWLDVNNGTGGKTVRFYAGRGTIADLIADPDAFLFDTVTTAGTTSIFSGTAPVELAINTELTDDSYFGRIRAAVIVEGSFAGTQRARPDFTIQTPGATSFVDAPGRTWTLGASSDIDGHRTRLLGELAAAGPDWPGHGVEETAQVTWEIAGVLRRMRQRDEPLQSTLYRHITSPTQISAVKAYWPLEDGSEAIAAGSPIEGVGLLSIGGSDWRFASDSTLASSSPLPHVNGVTFFAGHVPPYSSEWSHLDIFFRIDTPNTSASPTTIIAFTTSGTGASWFIDIDDTNVGITAFDSAGGGLVSTTLGIDSRVFGTWSLLSINLRQSGGNVNWNVDVVPIPLGLDFGTSGSYAGSVGAIEILHNWGGVAPTNGGISFGHLIVTVERSLGWLAKADSAFVGEPAGSRFDRLCREQNIPSIVDGFYGNFWDLILPRGAKPMGPQRPIKLLDLLTECAVVERAVIGEARELLGLTYRSNLYNQPPVLTVTNELGNPFAPARNDQGIVNDLTVSRPSGELHRQIEQPSINKAGPYPHNQPVNVETALQLPDLASWILTESLIREMRIPDLQIDLGKNTALFENWLAVRFGDLIQSDVVPPFFPAEEVRQILAGYTEEISTQHWAVTINGTPASVFDVAFRDDPDLGIRDTAGTVLDSDFDAGTDSSLVVATEVGPEWAVTAASNSALPFDLDVGGYRVPCTAIAAVSGGTQTFTVSTTVWPPVAKTIPAGTAIKVWRPARRALTAGAHIA